MRYGTIFKIAIFGHETWPLAKVPEVAHILPDVQLQPLGVEIKLIFALRARYRLIFKLDIFGDETWPLANVPEVVHIYFLPQGFKIEFIFAL